MRTAILACASFAICTSSSLRAQTIDTQCPPGTASSTGSPDNTRVAQDGCQKAIDLFKYTAPQLGLVLAGGNPTQGVAGTLGGPGRFSIGFRANGLEASLPEVDRVVPNTRGALQSTYTLDAQPIGFITGDAAIGLFGGFGESGIGALDAIVSASYVPEYEGESISVNVPSGRLKFGFGGKVGILRESSVAPAISVSYLERALPVVDITGVSGDDELLLQQVRVRAKSWRGVVGKKFYFIGLGAGYGRDTYDSSAQITVNIAPRDATQGGTGGPIELTQNLSRNNMFGTIWLESQVLRFIGEIGRVSGGTISTYNMFEGKQAADARTYASVGISFGL